MTNHTTNRIAARMHILHTERLLRAETIADRSARAVDDAVVEVTRIVKRERSGRAAKIATVLRGVLPQISQQLSADLPKLATWSHGQSVSIFAREIPRKWWRAVNPVTLLVGEADAPNIGSVDLPPAGRVDVATEPIVGQPRMSDEEWEAFLRKNLMPLPDAATVAEIVRTPINGVAWPERINSLSKLVEPERIAGLLAQQIPEGLTLQQLAKAIRPLVDGGIRASAMRIARTESLRVAQAMNRRGYEQIGELLAGVQIVATLDQNTRPEHVVRNGRIYYDRADGARTADNGDALPALPDEPNCRCWDIPVLKPPAEVLADPAVAAEFRNLSDAAIPDPQVYAGWFDQADPGRRKIAVGARRYNDAVARLSGQRPVEYADFVGIDGKLLSRKALAAESAKDRESRRGAVAELMRGRSRLLRQVSDVGFVSG